MAWPRSSRTLSGSLIFRTTGDGGGSDERTEQEDAADMVEPFPGRGGFGRMGVAMTPFGPNPPGCPAPMRLLTQSLGVFC